MGRRKAPEAPSGPETGSSVPPAHPGSPEPPPLTSPPVASSRPPGVPLTPSTPGRADDDSQEDVTEDTEPEPEVVPEPTPLATAAGRWAELEQILEDARLADDTLIIKSCDCRLKALRLASEWSKEESAELQIEHLERALSEMRDLLSSTYGGAGDQIVPPSIGDLSEAN